jgi:hypothetical protein
VHRLLFDTGAKASTSPGRCGLATRLPEAFNANSVGTRPELSAA